MIKEMRHSPLNNLQSTRNSGKSKLILPFFGIHTFSLLQMDSAGVVDIGEDWSISLNSNLQDLEAELILGSNLRGH